MFETDLVIPSRTNHKGREIVKNALRVKFENKNANVHIKQNNTITEIVFPQCLFFGLLFRR